ncbi:MAG: hypothetical protein EB127_27005, partial [Alphaproteobacteria bacterium]|nr:hypothetical protein [Alphaproteobacteria bacterium]
SFWQEYIKRTDKNTSSSIPQQYEKIMMQGKKQLEEAIKDLLGTIKTLLEQIVFNPRKRVIDLNYINQQQYKEIVFDWNKTDKAYPRDKTIQRLFEEQVERSQESIAVVYEEKQLTYKELNEKANQLAHYLINQYRVEPDTLIALCLDRSEHMLIGILAVLKAGGAYVPMDPNYPDERIRYILSDTKSIVVLTNRDHKQRLEGIINEGLNENAIELKREDNLFTDVMSIDDVSIGNILLLQSKYHRRIYFA